MPAAARAAEPTPRKPLRVNSSFGASFSVSLLIMITSVIRNRLRRRIWESGTVSKCEMKTTPEKSQTTGRNSAICFRTALPHYPTSTRILHLLVKSDVNARRGPENSSRLREMVDFGGQVVANGCLANLSGFAANEYH